MQLSLFCKPAFATAGQHDRQRPARGRLVCLAVASPQSPTSILERPALPAAGESEATSSPSTSSTATTSGLQAQEVDWETFIRSELFRTFQLGVRRAIVVLFPGCDLLCMRAQSSIAAVRQEIDAFRYSQRFQFTDPIFSSTGLSGFQQNLRLLRTVFDIDFVLHDCKASQDEVITRCAGLCMHMGCPLLQPHCP